MHKCKIINLLDYECANWYLKTQFFWYALIQFYALHGALQLFVARLQSQLLVSKINLVFMKVNIHLLNRH